MASLRLTDRFVANAVAPTGERLDFFDTQLSGLILRVTDRGRKTWVVRYRTQDGRQPRFTLGTYPAISLAEARDKAIDVIRTAQNGGDPASEKRRATLMARSRELKTFNDLAEAYISACENGEWMPKGKRQRARTIEDSRGVLRRYVAPKIGSKRIEEVTRPVVKKLLRDMAARGIGAQTKRPHAFIRQVFAWAISEFEEELWPSTPPSASPP